jgi:cytochrome b involved in lipid metabolism
MEPSNGETPTAPSPKATAAAAAADAPAAKAHTDRHIDTKRLMGTTHTEFTLEEVAMHNTPDDCWVTAKGVVYDVTDYIDLHPGGSKAIVRHAGQVVDSDFDFHSPHAQVHVWPRYAIGHIKSSGCAVM